MQISDKADLKWDCLLDSILITIIESFNFLVDALLIYDIMIDNKEVILHTW